LSCWSSSPWFASIILYGARKIHLHYWLPNPLSIGPMLKKHPISPWSEGKDSPKGSLPSVWCFPRSSLSEVCSSAHPHQTHAHSHGPKVRNKLAMFSSIYSNWMNEWEQGEVILLFHRIWSEQQRIVRIRINPICELVISSNQ
jgi:hypothetical protein